MKDYSLCTYTFNDHNLLSSFLDSIRNWSLLPKEIIIIDDHSESKFQCHDVGFSSITYIYNQENLGPTKTKQQGIDLAAYPYILSCDCDVRIEHNWAEEVYSILDKTNSLGMCSSSLSYECGNDSISRYLKKFCSDEYSGYRNFIAGPVWMITKKAWNDVGGWTKFQRRTHEDIELCRRLIDSGYKLYLTDTVSAKHIRLIHRVDVVKRHWQWRRGLYPDNLENVDKENEIDFIIGNSNKRIKDSLQENELLFVYIELLYIAHSIIDILALLNEHEEIKIFSSTLFLILNENRKLKYKLINDLKKIGHSIDISKTRRSEYWNKKLQLLSRLNHSGVTNWINDHGIRVLNYEDMTIKSDFSFHSINNR